MNSTFKKFFGITSTDYAQLVKNGAIIVDVRSRGEYASGHVNGSVNIALDQLSNNLHQLKDKDQPIITCCASGMRSASARTLLVAKGYKSVYDGGGWSSLQRAINN